MSERRLVDRVLAGDATAERELYDAHVDRIYRLAFRMTGSDDLAQDFTQEAFLRAFDRLDQFRGDAALGTWLHAIAVRVVLNGMRKVKRFRQREMDLNDSILPANPAPRAEPDVRARLERAIDDLPERYRLTFVMHDVEGYTHREIADALGVETGTSKSLLSRARARLREALADFAEEWRG